MTGWLAKIAEDQNVPQWFYELKKQSLSDDEIYQKIYQDAKSGFEGEELDDSLIQEFARVIFEGHNALYNLNN